jgi:hypothetical protein
VSSSTSNFRKNWIINRTLEEYLERHGREAFQAEARRQSAAATPHKWKDGEFWEGIAAETWHE